MASDIKDIDSRANIKGHIREALERKRSRHKGYRQWRPANGPKTIVSEDMVAAVNYLVNLPNEIGTPD